MLSNMRKFLLSSLKSSKQKFSRTPSDSTQVVSRVDPFSPSYKVNPELAKGVDYFEKYSKHRMVVPVYDLQPILNCTFVAPNATIIGEVSIERFSTVWHNCVIRGDINAVKIGLFCSIGDRTVIHTANSLPTGFPAVVHIGNHCIIQAGCSLYSCILEEECFVGANTVILEGSRLEKQSIVLPNSVVPPGRIIPARQVWGGNPVRFIREIDEGEIFANYAATYNIKLLGQTYLYHFTPWNFSYMQKESTRDDVDLNPEDILTDYTPYGRHGVKHYLHSNLNIF